MSHLAHSFRFRWAECQLQIIGSCVLPGAARKKLKQLPTTLYDSYDRILESISEENIGAVRSALMFLAYSIKPMAVEEIADAVLINVEEQSFDPEERTDDPVSVILELCSSLVTVTEAPHDDKPWLFSWTKRFGSLGVGNLFGLRATDPKVLRTSIDPVGPENDVTVMGMVMGADMVVGTQFSPTHHPSTTVVSYDRCIL